MTTTQACGLGYALVLVATVIVLWRTLHITSRIILRAAAHAGLVTPTSRRR